MASHLVFSHLASGLIQVIAKDTAHMMTVLETSTNDLASDDTYLVTDTPQILNVAIVNIPKITQKNNNQSLTIYKKYRSALSK